ncbi:MAG: CDP-diacylglycerol diphosphatase [Candidatus Xenobia bacterium]
MAGARPPDFVKLDRQHGIVELQSTGIASDQLTVATTPVSGIEDPQLEAPGAENYFADAWDNRRGPDTALAINARQRRSQDRLHIHSDRVDPALEQKLRTQLEHGGISAGRWSNLAFSVHGHPYEATFVPGNTLSQNLFVLVYQRLAAEHGAAWARQHMGQHCIAVVPEHGGFVVLAGKGFAEEWLLGHAHGPL